MFTNTPPSTIEAFFMPLLPHIQGVNTWAVDIAPPARADHVGYKCASTEEFEHLRRLFEGGSDFLYQSIISQRRIAVIRLQAEIQTALGPIRYLELSDQKPDNSQRAGFDHIEIYPSGRSLKALVTHCTAAGTVLQQTVRPHHITYDAVLEDGFKIRLENEPLIEKIKRDEMV